MSMNLRKGDEEARSELPALLDAAEKGQSTIITRRGRAVAVLSPLDAQGIAGQQRSLLPVEGSGRGLWGADSRRTVRRLRDGWSR